MKVSVRVKVWGWECEGESKYIFDRYQRYYVAFTTIVLERINSSQSLTKGVKKISKVWLSYNFTRLSKKVAVTLSPAHMSVWSQTLRSVLKSSSYEFHRALIPLSSHYHTKTLPNSHYESFVKKSWKGFGISKAMKILCDELIHPRSFELGKESHQAALTLAIGSFMRYHSVHVLLFWI